MELFYRSSIVVNEGKMSALSDVQTIIFTHIVRYLAPADEIT